MQKAGLAERGAMGELAATGPIASFIEARSDIGPDVGLYADLMKSLQGEEVGDGTAAVTDEAGGTAGAGTTPGTIAGAYGATAGGSYGGGGGGSSNLAFGGNLGKNWSLGGGSATSSGVTTNPGGRPGGTAGGVVEHVSSTQAAVGRPGVSEWYANAVGGKYAAQWKAYRASGGKG